MRCEWRQSNCPKDPTHQVNIAFRDLGTQNVYYFCEAHALMRISEAEDDDSLEILSAEEWALARTQDDE